MFEEIRACISSQLNIDEEEIKIESSFMNDLGADSLDIVELIMELEEKYDIEIPDEDVEKIATVGDIVEYIKAHSEE
ncbi:acyl carrier protein [Clostridium estertheticum]|uniref:Acyl carrier protein n=2 Tax=Clostridium estertheticum TaxID=238834 RepID=A0A1J0GI46_9CLOT|nr:acyl carrier protein [Clostridium estertheticum]APC40951.1 acyl carrier protein [Clostridium estertheticum subsp. estertheticum]MBZ9617181.1 acyl carrier protein [Clostridium estertheticum subsp. laramiense]MBU3170044.1 acyl carrier protein [Clostridium estertheticum]MBU3174749.1 acyl carrier protein [Clostridium estertheticum]MBU3214121.1 acyl carrier protein [Clostridium estertheticum]